jgi:hypothetical protein
MFLPLLSLWELRYFFFSILVLSICFSLAVVTIALIVSLKWPLFRHSVDVVTFHRYVDFVI